MELYRPGISTVYLARPLRQAVDSYFKYQKRLINPLLGGYEEFVKNFRR